MRVANSPDIIQQKINYLFCGFEFIREYIDKKNIFKKDTRNIIYRIWK